MTRTKQSRGGHAGFARAAQAREVLESTTERTAEAGTEENRPTAPPGGCTDGSGKTQSGIGFVLLVFGIPMAIVIILGFLLNG
jgi:hypothetical protein